MDIAAKDIDHKAPPAKPAAEEHGVAASMGRFAFRHRDFFTSKPGELLFRNVARTIVGVIPAAVAFMLTRKAFVKYDAFAQKNPGTLLTKALLPGNGSLSMWQRAGFIFTGFAVFRTFCRLWQRAYDRIFTPAPDAATATQAIRDIPKNIFKDTKDTLPAEIAGTMIAALPLVAVKAGFANTGTIDVPKGDFAMAKKGFVNDWLSSTVAYIPFFEIADRIYDSASGGQDSKNYYRKLKGLPEKEYPPAAHRKFGFFTNDGIGRIAFRRGGSLLLGVAAFMGGQRIAKASFGCPQPKLTGARNFLTSTAREYAAFVPFFGYTALADIYNQGYDALFNKLEKKHAAPSREV